MFTNTTTTPSRNYYGQIYIPGIPLFQGCATLGTFPIVIIVHAAALGGPFKEFHLKYKDLARHLVSHGYIVVSINRGLDASDGWGGDLGDVLEETVHFLFTKHSVRNNLINSVSVFAHSSGGARALQHAWRIAVPQNATPGKTARNIIAIIMLACTIPSGWNPNMADKLAKVSKAFMGMMTQIDSDIDAFGSKIDLISPMRSVFRIYDNMGAIPGTKDLLKVAKDMVFVRGGGHFVQNNDYCKAYVTAFLHRHVHNSVFYDKFLKLQQIPPSIAFPGRQYIHIHEGRQKLSIATFDAADNRLASVLPTNVQVKNVITYKDDLFSPHETTALRIDWDRTKAPGNTGQTKVQLILKQNFNVSNFKFLSFKIGQGYPVSTDMGPSFDVRVTLNTGSFVKASAYGGMIFYPLKAASPANNQEEQTKTVMHTYLIPLQDLHLVNLKAVNQIVFDFGVNPPSGTAKAIFYLGHVEFVI